MDPLIQTFEERLQEIDAYLSLLDALERLVQNGPPKIGETTITSQQQKILYSSVYLQLYNLVEATVTWCIDAVTAAAAAGGWLPSDLSDDVLREWIRVHARTHANLNIENRVECAKDFFDRISASVPISQWTMEKGGGGNWDDVEIFQVSARIGCDLQLSSEAAAGAKRIIREDKNALGLVKYLRNRLAHGSLSFAECGDGVTVFDLRDIKERTAVYLREVVFAFRSYIDDYKFLIPARRPIAGDAE